MNQALDATWLIEVNHTDNTFKQIDMGLYRGLLVQITYNGFTQQAIYPKTLLQRTETKLIALEPERNYYCFARVNTEYDKNSDSAKIKFSSVVRHSNSVAATMNVYGIK